MFIQIHMILLMGFCTIIALFYIMLLIIGERYKQYLEPLSADDFPFCDLYGAGFVVLQLVKYNFRSKKERQRRQYIEILYGERYGEYYLQIAGAQRISLALTVLVLGLSLLGLSGEIAMVPLAAAFSVLTYQRFANQPTNQVAERTDSLKAEFPNVASKLALLINAGMIMREAWTKIAYSGDALLYKEMQRTVEEIANGKAEIDAYYDFGLRCMIPEIKKFTSGIIQGLTKGNRELSYMIQEQSRELWESKKHNARQQGEKAASKLMIPICLMFIGIIIMVVVPIFANLGI